MRSPAIVAAIDGSPHSHAVVAWAVEEAAYRHVRLLVVICRLTYAEMHAFPAGLVMNGMDPIDLELARDRATRVVADVRLPDTVITRDLDIDVRAYAAAPVERLVALSQQAAVLIIGSRGSGSHSHGRLGSVTTALTRRARCPVVVIP